MFPFDSPSYTLRSWKFSYVCLFFFFNLTGLQGIVSASFRNHLPCSVTLVRRFVGQNNRLTLLFPLAIYNAMLYRELHAGGNSYCGTEIVTLSVYSLVFAGWYISVPCERKRKEKETSHLIFRARTIGQFMIGFSHIEIRNFIHI